MPTSIPNGGNIALSVALIAFVGAIIGGLVSLITTWYTLKAQRENIEKTETARLRWSKRWDVTTEIYASLMDAYWALVRLSILTGEESTRQEITDAQTTVQNFDGNVIKQGLFLPVDIENRIKKIADEFLQMRSDLISYAQEFYSKENRDYDYVKYMREFNRKHGKSLKDGEMKTEIEQLRKDFRKYLDEPIPKSE